MEAFRTLIKGWLGKVLLVLFLAPLALVGIEGYFSGSSEPVAVEVNGQDITQKEIDNWVKSQKDQYLRAVNNDETLLNNSVIEKQVYDAAIVRALLLQQANNLKLKLSDEQLGGLLRQQSAFQQDGQFSQQLLDNYLNGTRTTISQLISDFGQQTALTLLTSSIVDTAIYGAKDSTNLINLLSQERNTHLAEIKLDQFAQNFIATDAQIKAYYDKNIKTFVREKNVDLQYVVISKSQFSDQVQITEKDIEQQYQAYIANLNKDATRQISHILITTDNRTPEQALAIAQEVDRKLKAGESFVSLVQTYSEDPGSKAAQGKIDGYTVGAFGDAFDNAVLGLQKDQISAPIKTEFGYHLIRLDNLSAQNVPTLVEVRDQLNNELKTKKAEDAYQEAIGNANDLALQSDSLEALAEQYKVPLESAKNLVMNTNNPVLSDSAVKLKVFSNEVAQGDRNVSTGVSLKNGDTLWFKVSEYRAERPQTLAEAKIEIQAKLKRETQVTEAKASVKQLLADLKAKPAQDVIAKSPVKFQNVGPVPRYSQVVPLEIEKVIYSVPAPKENYWSANTVDFGDYLFVVAVSEIGNNPAFQLNEQQTKQIVNRYDHRGQQELNDYVEYLRSSAKIKNKKD